MDHEDLSLAAKAMLEANLAGSLLTTLLAVLVRNGAMPGADVREAFARLRSMIEPMTRDGEPGARSAARYQVDRLDKMFAAFAQDAI